jgi:hypothetical protein
LRPRKRALEQLRHSAKVEVDDHLMMLHALAALHRAKVPHDAIVTVAHASQSAILEHRGRMHSPTIQSNLERERLRNTEQISWLFESAGVCPVMRALLDFNGDVTEALDAR